MMHFLPPPWTRIFSRGSANFVCVLYSLIRTLSYALSYSRSEKLKYIWFFSHLSVTLWAKTTH